MANKIKKLKLKPSARDKRRYFLASASNAKIEAAILEYIGILGMAKSSYMKVNTKNFPATRGIPSREGIKMPASSGKSRTVGSCLTKSLEDVRAALAFRGIKIEKVSGTLKALAQA